MANFTKNVDWLSLTFSHDFPFKQYFKFDEFVRTGNGRNGYRHRFQGLNTGAIVQSGSRDDMGVNVAFSGTSLTYLRNITQLTDRQICARMLDFGGRASRVDLAITIQDGHITPQRFYDMLETEQIKTSARSHRLIKGKNGDIRGDTVYIGSRTSEKFVRYYNKAAEMGIKDGVAMMRLEMELKALHARAACHGVATTDASTAANTVFSDYLKTDDKELNEALSGDYRPFQPFIRPETNTERWLMSQVTKALARACMTNSALFGSFVAQWDQELMALKFQDDNA